MRERRPYVRPALRSLSASTRHWLKVHSNSKAYNYSFIIDRSALTATQLVDEARKLHGLMEEESKSWE